MRAHTDRIRPLIRLAPLAALAIVSACASTPPGPPQTAVIDTAAAARVATATTPTRQLHVLFDWSVKDPSVNFSGKGVLRLDRARRGRVDLFGPRGEQLMAAIVENDQMRMQPAYASNLLPPASLMWSVLGVFRRPTDAPLTGTAIDNGALVLDYSRDGARWRFRFVDDVMRHTEWTSGSGRRTVELTGTAGLGVPRTVLYRDWTEFRELTLEVTNVEETQGFDADVWILPGQR
jgi:hypothetical protein